MHRFHVPPGACEGATLTLPEAEAHHARHVVRLRVGERVTVLNGAGGELLCEVEEMSRRGVVLQVLQRGAQAPLPYQVTLLPAVSKARAMDLIIQKATELGAHRIVPLLAERSISQLDQESAAGRLAKWRAGSLEAAKQCGLAWFPSVELPLSPQAFLARGEGFDLALVASLQPGAAHPREPFRGFVAEWKRLPRTVAVWVGPEGDFTPAELDAIRAGGAQPITLGSLVLRSETAVIYCLSVINYELQAPAR